MRLLVAVVATLTLSMISIFWIADSATGAQSLKTVFRFDTFGDEQLWTKGKSCAWTRRCI